MTRPRWTAPGARTDGSDAPDLSSTLSTLSTLSTAEPTGVPDGGLGAAVEPLAPSPRSLTLSLATVALSVLVAVGALLPVPYAISSPGPTRDTLGQHGGTPLVVVQDDVATYESSGQLLLTTVSVSGGPGHPVSLPSLVRGWLDRDRAVRPVEEVFAPMETQEDIDQRNQAAMVSSQENATVAALEELGYEVPTVLRVADAVPGTGAEGVVREDDVIVALDGQDVPSFSTLVRRLDEIDPGAAVVLSVERDGARHDLDLVTTDGGDGRALLGVFIAPEFDMPVDVTVQIENIGGPSAGMMFALGIIDRLTEADETGGATVAGSGTVDVAGTVGAIGGIRQKLVGAERDGATWFLVPEGNCAEVVGHLPAGLEAVQVSTLAEARAAVEAIGSGETDGLPGCS